MKAAKAVSFLGLVLISMSAAPTDPMERPGASGAAPVTQVKELLESLLAPSPSQAEVPTRAELRELCTSNDEKSQGLCQKWVFWQFSPGYLSRLGEPGKDFCIPPEFTELHMWQAYLAHYEKHRDNTQEWGDEPIDKAQRRFLTETFPCD